MSEQNRGLLQAVLDAPGEDGPRQVIADWYMEQGNPRGEFIHAQLMLSGRRSMVPMRRKQFRDREKTLLSEHESAWMAPVTDMLGRSQGHEFRRGFLDHLCAKIDPLVRFGEAIWRTEPVVSVEVLGAGPASCELLAQAPFLPKLTRLTIRGAIGDEGIAALAQSPRIQGLAALNVINQGITDAGVMALASSPYVSCTMLALSGNDITDAGLAVLAASPVLSRVTRLYVSRNPISDEGVAALAESPHVHGLVELGLDGVEELGDDGVTALLDSPNVSALHSLQLRACYELSGSVVRRVKDRWPRARL